MSELEQPQPLSNGELAIERCRIACEEEELERLARFIGRTASKEQPTE